MDRCIAFSLLLIGTPVLAIPTEREILIHFEKDISQLDATANEALAQFLNSLVIQGDCHFTVEGHTDSDGSYRYNDTLAAARARIVRDYLLSHGVDPNLVELHFRGKRSPGATNADDAGMALNRRVRVVFIRHVFASVQELREALQKDHVQYFNLDPSRENLITGTGGSTVKFPANAFTKANGGSVDGPVNVAFTEALDALQMVAFGLSTRSGDQLLETDGMVRVVAFDATGNPLQLKPSSPMTITMPVNEVKPRMELFLSLTGTDWSVARVSPSIAPMADWTAAQPMPLRIVRDLPAYKEDQRGKPLKPGIPVMPKAPSPPIPYTVHRPWWGFITPRLTQAREERGQTQANKRKADMDQRYQKRVDKYWADKKDFPAAMARYAVQKSVWDSLKRIEHETWWKEVYEPARLRYDSIQGLFDAPYLANMAAWEARRDSLQLRYARWADTVCTVTRGELSNYVFATTQLGWINCDRFYEVPTWRKAPVIARSPVAGAVQAYVVFTGMRMLLSMDTLEHDKLRSPPVPLDEPAVIFTFTVKDGQAQLCVQPVVNGKVPVLEFKPTTVAEMSKQLAELAGT